MLYVRYGRERVVIYALNLKLVHGYMPKKTGLLNHTNA
jgi:hypothetical protein